MSTNTQLGYLQEPYLVSNYLEPRANEALGFSFNAQIEKHDEAGAQYLAYVLSWNGSQFEAVVNKTEALAAQNEAHINKFAFGGVQFTSRFDTNTFGASQFEASIFNSAALASQFLASIDNSIACGAQFSGEIGDLLKGISTQFLGEVDRSKAGGTQNLAKINNRAPLGFQYLALIDSLDSKGAQIVAVIDNEKALGAQFISLFTSAVGTQFRAALYNIDNLRVLHRFPSRGTSTGNWTASSTHAGDFGIANVNTDLVEQVWRSVAGVKSGIVLVCDTQVPQGVLVDTIALLGHNMTTSAIVDVVGANNTSFSGDVINFRMTIAKENAFHISQTLPSASYRYWRFTIDDSTNAANFIQIGTIVFGESVIVHNENFADPIKLKRTHYSDKIETEGFTSAQNDRGVKKAIGLDFKSIDSNGVNFSRLLTVFDEIRTNLKALWIPTPRYPSRYASFAKLTNLPDETYVDNGENAAYVDFSIEIDEAK